VSCLISCFYRVRDRLRREGIRRFAVRRFVKSVSQPYVSFSFDDFPSTAVENGAPLLEKYGARGTFFVSMGLLDTESPVGRIATIDQLRSLVRDGHEIGCHTYDHQDARFADRAVFVRSLVENRSAFRTAFPSLDLRVFAYPLDGPNLSIKLITGQRFLCCRGGEQTFNGRVMDLNLLNAFFLDWRSRDDPSLVEWVIDQSVAANGWLIFACHDVAEEPSQYGCMPNVFESVVRYVTKVGARIRPIGEVCRELGVGEEQRRKTIQEF